jgi:hypothetical protein
MIGIKETSRQRSWTVGNGTRELTVLEAKVHNRVKCLRRKGDGGGGEEGGEEGKGEGERGGEEGGGEAGGEEGNK